MKIILCLMIALMGYAVAKGSDKETADTAKPIAETTEKANDVDKKSTETTEKEEAIEDGPVCGG